MTDQVSWKGLGLMMKQTTKNNKASHRAGMPDERMMKYEITIFS